MKKIFAILLMMASAVFAKNNESYLEGIYVERTGTSGSAGCRYVPGYYVITANNSMYEVKDGYLVCTNRNNFVTVFEGVFEEEGRGTFLNVGNITIASPQ